MVSPPTLVIERVPPLSAYVPVAPSSSAAKRLAVTFDPPDWEKVAVPLFATVSLPVTLKAPVLLRLYVPMSFG